MEAAPPLLLKLVGQAVGQEAGEPDQQSRVSSEEPVVVEGRVPQRVGGQGWRVALDLEGVPRRKDDDMTDGQSAVAEVAHEGSGAFGCHAIDVAVVPGGGHHDGTLFGPL